MANQELMHELLLLWHSWANLYYLQQIRCTRNENTTCIFSFDLCSISSVTMTRTLLYFYQMLVLQFLVI